MARPLFGHGKNCTQTMNPPLRRCDCRASLAMTGARQPRSPRCRHCEAAGRGSRDDGLVGGFMESRLYRCDRNCTLTMNPHSVPQGLPSGVIAIATAPAGLAMTIAWRSEVAALRSQRQNGLSLRAEGEAILRVHGERHRRLWARPGALAHRPFRSKRLSSDEFQPLPKEKPCCPVPRASKENPYPR